MVYANGVDPVDSRWNRKFLNSYWYSVLVYVIAALLTVAAEHGGGAKVWSVAVKPGVELALTVLAMEGLIRVVPQGWIPYLLVLAGDVGVCIVASTLLHIAIVPAALVLPMILSVAFFRKRLILYAFGLGLLTYAVLLATVYRPHGAASLPDAAVVLGLLTACLIALLQVTQRGRDVLEHLLASMRERQNLLADYVEIQRSAKLDALTGLYNRTAFGDHMERLFEVCVRNRLPLHLAVLDIDNFKAVNDTFGHTAGDDVLQLVAEELKAAMPNDVFIARFGGEEFVIAAVDMPVDEFVRRLEAARVRIGFRSLRGVRVTVSAGVHTLAGDEGPSQLFARADAALYEAKRQGKNRIVSM